MIIIMHLPLLVIIMLRTTIQKSLTTLVSLDLYNCPITSSDKYRTQVFHLLTSLQSLDGVNEKGEELDSEGGGDGEEEEEEEEEGEEEEEPGLDYLLNNDLASVINVTIMTRLCIYCIHCRTARKGIMIQTKMSLVQLMTKRFQMKTIKLEPVLVQQNDQN